MNEKNVKRFESELLAVGRKGTDALLGYIHRSDFYTAPASTKYHLSCPGGLLQHSLDVLDAMRGILPALPSDPTMRSFMNVPGAEPIPDSSAVVTALLHDICKTYFYRESSRNVKNEKTGKWEKVPSYIVDDQMPLGHGPKSVVLLKQFIPLSTAEMYAIWHHMGPYGLTGPDILTWEQAMEKHPLVWALHCADMIATHFMETKDGPIVHPAPEPEAPRSAPAAKQSVCRSCGAPLKWITSRNGKKMPCDAEPIPYWQGTSENLFQEDGTMIRCSLQGTPGMQIGTAYRSHFSTCPDADRFRKPKEAPPKEPQYEEAPPLPEEPPFDEDDPGPLFEEAPPVREP